MSAVVDANLLFALVLNDPRAPAVERRFREWASAGETLHAAELLATKPQTRLRDLS